MASYQRKVMAPCNGWEHWYYEDAATGERRPIDVLREQIRREKQ